MGTRSKTFLTSGTGHPTNVKYTEQTGDQTRNYPVTLSIQKLLNQSAQFIKAFVRYTYMIFESHDLKDFGHF